MKILVCGGRNFFNEELIRITLDSIKQRKNIECIISGHATGADALGEAWAYRNNIGVMIFPANWENLGRAAGPIRNKFMLDHGQPNLVLAFPGGKGTRDLIKKARAAGIEVIEVEDAGPTTPKPV